MKSRLKIQNYYLVAVFIIFCIAATPLWVFAADIRIDAENREIKTGESFEANIFFSTEEPINALEGRVSFPTDLLEVKELRDGNSIINFWIERPRIKSNDEIIFSGITPGGFKGEKGLLFSIIFRAKKPGEGSIKLDEVKALKNDGMGTASQVTISDFQFSISEKAPAVISERKEDREPPETFQSGIAQDESIFGGKWFLVFATQDKISGIDHYEVKESRQKIFAPLQKWLRRESPYILGDQELRSYVFVKAVDKAGNERIMRLAPKYPLEWYENCENWIIIIIGVLIAILIAKKLWRKKHT